MNSTQMKQVGWGFYPNTKCPKIIKPSATRNQTMCSFTAEVIKNSKTILMNGPVGAFENPAFAEGTKAVLEAIVEATKNGAVSVIGGGDSVSAAKKFCKAEDFTHVSTGGGASLEFIEGKVLPGVAALDDK